MSSVTDPGHHFLGGWFLGVIFRTWIMMLIFAASNISAFTWEMKYLTSLWCYNNRKLTIFSIENNKHIFKIFFSRGTISPLPPMDPPLNVLTIKPLNHWIITATYREGANTLPILYQSTWYRDTIGCMKSSQCCYYSEDPNIFVSKLPFIKHDGGQYNLIYIKYTWYI